MVNSGCSSLEGDVDELLGAFQLFQGVVLIELGLINGNLVKLRREAFAVAAFVHASQDDLLISSGHMDVAKILRVGEGIELNPSVLSFEPSSLTLLNFEFLDK